MSRNYEKEFFIDENGNLGAKYRFTSPVIVVGCVKDDEKPCCDACGACIEETSMSEDYVEYGRDNIQTDPLRVQEIYEVVEIERVAGTPTIEIFLFSKLGEISLRLPLELAKSFYVGQQCHMLLTRVIGLDVKD